MVTVDRLSKQRHYTACNTTTSALDLAKLFVREIWRLHGLPDTIVSDRGPQFVAELWKAVCYRLRVNVSLSTAYHPETDGQTEISNAYLEQYLRLYIDYAQDDWETWLPLAEFSANNATSASTGMTPFFANYGYHPRMSFGPPRPITRGSSKQVIEGNLAGNSFVQKMEDVLQTLRDNLQSARDAQERAANVNRAPSPAYKVGDRVFLDARNITTARPMKKLDDKYIGDFRISKVINSHTYQLDLPYELRSLHNSFHTSLLRPSPQNPMQGQAQAPSRPIAIDENGEQLWAIEAITNSKRTKNRGFEYQILWRGDEAARTWEPLQNVVNAFGSIREFERRFPKKIRPTKEEIKTAKAALRRERE